jgi:hypothetical protein
MEWVDMIQSAIDAGWSTILFEILLLLGVGALLLFLLFFLLAVRGAWRWLTRHTWSDVVVSHERKVFLSK